ncbi:MAG: hypothetical protein HOQ02_07930 [Lysobacter sp.]|nr:hypothetical protein [Lysobacter sp.]
MAVNGPPPSVRGSRLAPWAGMIAAFAGALVQHQGIGDALHFHCGNGMGSANLYAGIIALALMAVGGAISWRVARDDGDANATRRFVARLSLMAVALFALMVVWQTLAGMLVPSCPG